MSVTATNEKLAFGGYFDTRRPVAMAREAGQAERPWSHLVAITGSLEVDLAVRIPSINTLTYGVLTLGVFGLLPRLREAVESGRATANPWGATSIIRALQAGARTDPYALSRTLPPSRADESTLGSSHRIPAIRIDDLFLHVPYADEATGYAWGYGVGCDLILAAAANRVHVSYDVPVTAPPALPNLFCLPGHLVHDLVHRPMGAFPTSCWPLYGPHASTLANYAHARGGLIDARYERHFMTGSHGAFVRWALDKAPVSEVLSFGPPPNIAVVEHRRELAKWA